MPISYRMHPRICDFISRSVYEDRLDAARGNERNAVHYPGKPPESGLRWRPVEHDHNASSSEAEADAVVDEVVALLEAQCSTSTRALGPLTKGDILIVSPYNAQRRLDYPEIGRARDQACALGRSTSSRANRRPS